jgi:hypothetical protein
MDYKGEHMRYFKISMLIFFALLMAISLEVTFAQNATNASSTMNASLPQAAGSRYIQLSGLGGIEEAADIFGNESPNLFNRTQMGTVNLERAANATAAFANNPSVNILITRVDPINRWVEITNDGITATELTGWMLVSGGNVTYTFPAIELEDDAALRIREGVGNSTATEIYTNSTAPLWTGNSITLFNEAGDTISTLSVPS